MSVQKSVKRKMSVRMNVRNVLLFKGVVVTFAVVEIKCAGLSWCVVFDMENFKTWVV